MANSAAGWNPAIMWSSARQDIWNAMVAQGHIAMQRLLADVASGNVYPLTGEREMIAYHITGNATYAATAYQRLFEDGWFNPPNRNATREYFTAKIIGYHYLLGWMTEPQRAAAEAYLLNWADHPNGLEGMVPSDSDQTTGEFFAAVLMDATFDTDYLTTSLGGVPLGNGSAVRADADYFSSRLTSTAADTSSFRNTIRWYCETLSDGGVWCESSEYNPGTVVLLRLGWQSSDDKLGADYFPEAATFLSEALIPAKHHLTPDLLYPYQYGDEQNPRQSRNFVRHPFLAAVGAHDVSEAIFALKGIESGIYARYFLFCDPYSVAVTPSPTTYYAEGQRVLTVKTASTHFGVWTARSGFDVHHHLPNWGEWQAYIGGEHFGHPVGYGYPGMAMNALLASGMQSQLNREVLGYWEGTHGGNPWVGIRVRTNGSVLTSTSTPSFADRTRDIVWLPGEQAVVIRDEVDVDDPRNLTGGLSVYPSYRNWNSVVAPELVATPTATTIVVKRTGGQEMPFGVHDFAIEWSTGSTLAGQIGWAQSTTFHSADGLINYYTFTFNPGTFTGAPAAGDACVVRGANWRSPWEQIETAPALLEYIQHCRALPTVSGANDIDVTHTTPGGQHVRVRRLTPSVVDAVEVIDNRTRTLPDGDVTTDGIVNIGDSEEAYWPYRVSTQIDSEGEHELIHVTSVAANLGAQPATQLISGGAIVGNSLVLFGEDAIEVTGAGSGGEPVALNFVIPSGGATFPVTFDEAVTGAGGGTPGVPTLSMSGGAVTATYSSGDETETITYSLSRTIQKGETGTASFAAGAVESVSDGTDLAATTNRRVSNQSLQDAVAPNCTGATASSDGARTAFTFSEPVTFGGVGNCGMTLSASAGPVTLTALSGDNTSTLTFSNSRLITAAETVTRSYAPGTITDLSVTPNALTSFTDAAVTNTSTLNPADAVAPGILASFSGQDNTPTGTVSATTTGVSVGDLLIALVESSLTTVASVSPDVWTLLETRATSNPRGYLYYRIATADDAPGRTYNWTLTDTTRQSAVVILRIPALSYDLDNLLPANDWEGVTNSPSVSAHAAPTLTTATANNRIMRVFISRFSQTTTLTPPANHTLVKRIGGDTSTSTPVIAVYQTAQSAAAATGTATFTTSGNQFSVVWTIAVRPVVDAVKPTVSGTVTIEPNGRFFTVPHSEAVSGPNFADPEGYGLSGGHSISYESGKGTTSLRYQITPPVEAGEVVTLDYGEGNIADLSGNTLDVFEDLAVSNQSTYPIGLTLEILDAGNRFKVTADRAVTGWNVNDWTLTASGGAVDVIALVSTTTTSATFATDRVIIGSPSDETVTVDAPQGAIVDEDGVESDALSDAAVTNNSGQAEAPLTEPDLEVEEEDGTPVSDGGTIELTATAGSALSLTLVLRNTGTAALAVAGINTAWPFTLTEDPTGTIDPGDTAELTVSIDTSFVGTVSSSLEIASSDPETPVYDVGVEITVNAQTDFDDADVWRGRKRANVWY